MHRWKCSLTWILKNSLCHCFAPGRRVGWKVSSFILNLTWTRLGVPKDLTLTELLSNVFNEEEFLFQPCCKQKTAAVNALLGKGLSMSCGLTEVEGKPSIIFHPLLSTSPALVKTLIESGQLPGFLYFAASLCKLRERKIHNWFSQQWVILKMRLIGVSKLFFFVVCLQLQVWFSADSCTIDLCFQHWLGCSADNCLAGGKVGTNPSIG